MRAHLVLESRPGSGTSCSRLAAPRRRATWSRLSIKRARDPARMSDENGPSLWWRASKRVGSRARRPFKWPAEMRAARFRDIYSRRQWRASLSYRTRLKLRLKLKSHLGSTARLGSLRDGVARSSPCKSRELAARVQPTRGRNTHVAGRSCARAWPRAAGDANLNDRLPNHDSAGSSSAGGRGRGGSSVSILLKVPLVSASTDSHSGSRMEVKSQDARRLLIIGRGPAMRRADWHGRCDLIRDAERGRASGAPTGMAREAEAARERHLRLIGDAI